MISTNVTSFRTAF